MPGLRVFSAHNPRQVWFILAGIFISQGLFCLPLFRSYVLAALCLTCGGACALVPLIVRQAPPDITPARVAQTGV